MHPLPSSRQTGQQAPRNPGREPEQGYAQGLAAAMSDYSSLRERLEPVRHRLAHKRQLLQDLQHQNAVEDAAIADLQASIAAAPSMYSRKTL